jgi:Type IV secretion system pilin
MYFKTNRALLISFFSVLMIVAVVLPIVVMAQPTGDQACADGTKLCNPIRFNTIQCFFKEVLKIAAEIGGVFVVIGIIYSGFLFVSARGNAEELGKAKRAITYTVIGAALVLGAWAFSVGIANTINTIVNGSFTTKIVCPD